MKVSVLTGSLSGTPYLSSYLKNQGIDAELVSIDHNDFAAPHNETVKLLNNLLVDHIKKTSPDLIGISTFHITDLVEDLSKLEIPIILGGPETLQTISYLHEYEPDNLHYTFGMEGLPIDLPKLLDYLAGKDFQLKDIRGLIYRENGNLKYNEPVWKKSYYLDNKPDINFTFVNKRFKEKIDTHPLLRLNQFWVPDMLGCPHAECTFCSIEKPYLSFTPKEVTQLIKDVLDQNPDMPIGLNTQSTHKIGKICEELKKQEIQPAFLVFMTRSDSFIKNYSEVIRALETGIPLDVDCIGFESFLQEDLDRLNKGITVEQNLQTVNKLRELDRKYDNFHYKNPNGHGLIPYLPWSNPKTIYEHFKILNKHEMWDIFNVHVLSNYLQINFNEPAKDELLDLIASNDTPNVRLLQMRSYTGNIAALVWIYTDEKMIKLFDFSRKAYDKITKDRFVLASAKTIGALLDTKVVEKTNTVEASKFMIEKTYEVADFIVNH